MMRMHVTIYPNDLALVEKEMVLSVDDGRGEIQIDGFPTLMDISSFRCIPSTPGIRMVEYSMPMTEPTEESPRSLPMRMVMEAATGEWPCRLSYHTAGLSWSSSYTIVTRGDVMDIAAFAGIMNRCGIDLEGAMLHLVSKYDSGGVFISHDVSAEVSIQDGEMKHIELFSLLDVPLHRRYVAPYDSDGIVVTRTFYNDVESGMGFEMPPGDVRIYDEVGNGPILSYVDAFRFPAIPPDSIIELSSEMTDDIEMEGEWDRFGTATMMIVNHLDEDVSLEVEERCPEDDLILSSSHDFIRRSDGTIGFIIPLPALGSEILNYTIDPSLIDGDWDRRTGWFPEAEEIPLEVEEDEF